MIAFTTTLLKFDKQGEKTGWTYIEIPEDLADQLKPSNKKSFRVKGKLDEFSFDKIALLPMGNGNFIMAINAEMRKQIHKNKGAMVAVQLEVDERQLPVSEDLLTCLADEPIAMKYFNKLPGSHKNWYNKWIEEAKTAETKAKRIAQTVAACSKQMHFYEFMRVQKSQQL